MNLYIDNCDSMFLRKGTFQTYKYTMEVYTFAPKGQSLWFNKNSNRMRFVSIKCVHVSIGLHQFHKVSQIIFVPRRSLYRFHCPDYYLNLTIGWHEKPFN